MSNPSFFDTPHSGWDILEYLNQHDPTADSYNHQFVLDRWIKSLTTIASDTQLTSKQRGKASFLLDKYKHPGRDSDRNRAREWLCTHQVNKKRKLKSGASVNIFQAPVNQGTFNNATFYQSGSEGQASRAASTKFRLDSAKELPEDFSCPQVRKGDAVYQAPVNQGTFNDSTFDQVVNKRGLPEDPEQSFPQDEATGSNIGRKKHVEDIAAAAQTKKGNTDFIAIYNEFVATYKAMTTESKYVFSVSGRVLEDVIYENASALTTKNSAHLWVIVLDDSAINSWLQPQELEELRARTLPIPETDEVFLASMARFSLADTADEFRRIAEEVSYRQQGESYDRSKHFDAAWVNTVILSMLSILESPNNLLLYPSLREGWFDCNPWSFLIDQCLLGLDGVLVQRKEILCLALKLVENLCSEPQGKGNHGRRFDAIIHTLGDFPVIEYGAIEVAKSFESIHTKKWITDSTKLVQALRAMLFRLHELVDHDENTVKKLQVVGLLNAGLNLQIIRMNALNGNIFLLERGKIRSLPTTVGGLKGIFSVMISIFMFKKIIRNSVLVVKGYSGLACNSQKTQQELFEEMMKQNDL